MKRNIILSILFGLAVLQSCKKQPQSPSVQNSDSIFTKHNEGSSDVKSPDTLNEQHVPADTRLTKTDTLRIIQGNKLPVKLEGQFVKDQQKLTIKIENFDKPQVVARIIPSDGDMNIRLNQIRLADGSFDGPFGRNLTYKISQKGEIWLIIGHDLMADGKMTGTFKVEID